MPRTPPSPAEQELAAAVSARHKRVTPRQLERWRGWEFLHPLPRRGLGRGRGSESYVTEELIEEAVAVTELMAEVRARPLGALTLFARGRYVAESAVRAAYVEVVDFLLAELEAEKRPEDESMLDTLDRYARNSPGAALDHRPCALVSGCAPPARTRSLRMSTSSAWCSL